MFPLIFLSIFLAESLVQATTIGLQCFVPGECLNSEIMSTMLTNNSRECLEHCHDVVSCEWFTYYPDTTTCAALSGCLDLNTTYCTDCVSGEDQCTNFECGVPGLCHGALEGVRLAETEDDCKNFCQASDRCFWHSFDSERKTCLMTNDCPVMDKTCASCTSWERGCTDPMSSSSNSSATTTTTTTMTTTTTTMTATTTTMTATTTTMTATTTTTTATTTIPELRHYLLSEDNTSFGYTDLEDAERDRMCSVGDLGRIEDRLIFGTIDGTLTVVRSYGSIYQYSSTDNAWNQLSFGCPQGGRRSSSANVDGQFIVFLTYDGRNVYSVDGNSCKFLGQMPVDLPGACVTSWTGTNRTEHKVYFLGSVDVNMNKKNVAMTINSSDMSAEFVDSFADRSRGCTKAFCGTTRDGFVVMGGGHDPLDARVDGTQVVMYEEDSMMWLSGPSLPFSMRNAMALPWKDSFLVAGGSIFVEDGDDINISDIMGFNHSMNAARQSVDRWDKVMPDSVEMDSGHKPLAVISTDQMNCN